MVTSNHKSIFLLKNLVSLDAARALLLALVSKNLIYHRREFYFFASNGVLGFWGFGILVTMMQCAKIRLQGKYHIYRL